MHRSGSRRNGGFWTAPYDLTQNFLDAGPYMNWLGKRQPELYGTTTADQLDDLCRAHADATGYDLTVFFTNTEGVALDRICEAVEASEIDGLVMNPAAWSTGSGAAMRDCLRSIAKPYIEVHIRNQYKMPHVSSTADLADAVIQGLGVGGYGAALETMYRRSTNGIW